MLMIIGSQSTLCSTGHSLFMFQSRKSVVNSQAHIKEPFTPKCVPADSCSLIFFESEQEVF